MKIKTNNGLLIEGNSQAPFFTVITARNARMQVIFQNVVTQQVSASDTSFGYYLTDDIVCHVSSKNGIVAMIFSRESTSQAPVEISMELIGFLLQNSEHCTGFIGGTEIEFRSINNDAIAISNGIISIIMKGVESKYTISVKNSEAMERLGVEMMSISAIAPTLNIPEGSKPPEFALGIYDESSFSRPRPTRFGMPVISTVPAEPPYTTTTVPPALTSAELSYYNSGVGPSSRTMYFKAFCNTQIPSVSPNIIPVSLMIYMPNGSDTLAAPIIAPLITSDNGLTFTGSAIFNQEDTVNYVDGICCFNVYVPLHMQVSLPLRLTVGGVINQQSSLITMLSTPELKSNLKRKRSKSKDNT